MDALLSMTMVAHLWVSHTTRFLVVPTPGKSDIGVRGRAIHCLACGTRSKRRLKPLQVLAFAARVAEFWWANFVVTKLTMNPVGISQYAAHPSLDIVLRLIVLLYNTSVILPSSYLRKLQQIHLIIVYRNLSPILHQLLNEFLIHLRSSFHKCIFAVTHEPQFASPITVHSGHER